MTDIVPWDEFLKTLDWKQGEHMTLVGPTGCGKTTLARAVLPRRKYVTIAVTKKKDPSLDKFKGEGYVERKEFYDTGEVHPRILLKPTMKRLEDRYRQAEVFHAWLESIYRSGGWTAYLDELRYITRTLGLQPVMETLYLQGRALKVTVVGATQRPAWVPREAFSEPTHFFLWRVTDKQDTKRLSEISGRVNVQQLVKEVGSLGFHDTLYVNARTGQMVKTNVEGK